MQWLVRSQDKKFIASIENVETVTVNGKHIIRSGGKILGVYHTEQRCIEVIDDMQNFINATRRYLLTVSNDISAEDYDRLLEQIETNVVSCVMQVEQPKVFPVYTNAIYEMPKE